jgi:flagellar hook-associated protein 1 FlgK
MSISASLANALTGLAAAGRAGQVVSSNVANALTEGYARRELELSAQSLGGTGAGVRVEGVTRAVTQAVLNDRRLADAEVANGDVRLAFQQRIEGAVGDPDDGASLSARYAAFESALVAAASRPDSGARLDSVLGAAQDLAATLNNLDATLQAARVEADGAIATEVGRLNDALAGIEALNTQITAFRSAGRDATALMDQRQTLIDRVAEIVPVREVPRDRDQVALYTTGGAILLESKAVEVGFARVGIITADMTLASGALSGLTLNGRPVSTADDAGMGGGRLGALFAVRDDLAPAAQTRIDALARDLAERFEDPALDATRAPGDPGLFTDRGAVIDPLTETGLAGRIAVNAAIDPAAGGATWRLRDGLGAAAAGPVGDASLLAALGAALTATRVPASGGFLGTARSGAGLAADVLSGLSAARQTTEDRLTSAGARAGTLADLQAQDGVDTDAELQNLLLIEQAYAANARVIQSMDELIRQLIGL